MDQNAMIADGIIQQATCRVFAGNEQGTGWFCSSAGYIMTAGHVVTNGSQKSISQEENKDVRVKLWNQEKEISARVVYAAYFDTREKFIDFAVLKIEHFPSILFIPVDLSKSYSPGVSIYISGYGERDVSQSPGEGTYISPLLCENDENTTMLKVRCADAAQRGISGAAVYCQRTLGAIGIQTKASIYFRGALRDSILAFPMNSIIAALQEEVPDVVAHLREANAVMSKSRKAAPTEEERQANEDWDNYWEKLIQQTNEPLRWFKKDGNITIASMFLPEQQLRWKNKRVKSTSEYEDPDKYQYANCRDKLLQEICDLKKGSEKRCICVVAESGVGLTTLATVLCGRLAEMQRRVLHVKLEAFKDVNDMDVEDVIKKLFVSPNNRGLRRFHAFPTADTRPLVLVFDGFNRLKPDACIAFFEKLNVFLENEQNTIALLFLNVYARSRAKSELNNFWQGYELMNYDERHGAKNLREKWYANYEECTGNTQDILSELKKETNENLFRRMVHPTVCTLVFRFFASDPANLPKLKNRKSSIELFRDIVQRILCEADILTDEVEKGILPQKAYELWQSRALTTDFEQGNPRNLCFFAEEATGKYRFYDCFRDYFCAQFICNTIGTGTRECNTVNWFSTFGAQPATDDMLSFLYGFIQLEEDDWCSSAQRCLGELLKERLEKGWEWTKKRTSTKDVQEHVNNADIILIASLSSLGDKIKSPVTVTLSDESREYANRWISQLVGGSSSIYLNDSQGLRYLNWIHFATKKRDAVIMDAAFFLGNNFNGMDNTIEWVMPKYIKSYMDANCGYASQMIERQDSEQSQSKNAGSEGVVDSNEAYYRLSRKARHQFERKPARLECFEPQASHFDLVSLLRKLGDLYYPAIDVSGCSSCMIHSDRNMLKKVFLRLFNNAEKYNILNLPIYAKLEDNEDGVIVTVENYAISIGEADKKQLKSYRFRAPNYLGQVGSGEGLWYCEQAAKALRATLSISCEEIEKLRGYDLVGIACFGTKCFKNGQVIASEWMDAKDEVNEQLKIKNETSRDINFNAVLEVFDQLETIVGKKRLEELNISVMHMRGRSAGMRLALPGTAEFRVTFTLPRARKEKCND